ncbi:MAG: RNA polymerase sigma factor [Planctomycetaceae bacterium]
MTDVALIRQAAAGNRTAQGELARESYRRVLAYCQSRVFHLADAEELAQESLIRAMVDLPALSEPTAYGAWLRGLANHVCSDWHRHQRRVPQSELMDVAASPETDPADQAAMADERVMLQSQMRELPEELREVLLLFYYEDFSYDEMAAWLGVARATVSERLSRARNLLRIRMGQLRRCST